MTDLETQIAEGRALEKDGSEQAAIDYFRKLADAHPEHARVQFELGGAYDFAGFEAEAIPHYRRAIDLGLSGEELPRVFLQLGSSLRNVGQHAEGIQLLTDACARYPEHRALRIFLALAQHSAEHHKQAVITLLDTLLLDADKLDGYQRAIRYYTDELR